MLFKKEKRIIKLNYIDFEVMVEPFEIRTHLIEDGFLVLILPDYNERWISLSLIRGFDIIREEISDDETGSDS